jgi:hypothetical protein
MTDHNDAHEELTPFAALTHAAEVADTAAQALTLAAYSGDPQVFQEAMEVAEHAYHAAFQAKVARFRAVPT